MKTERPICPYCGNEMRYSSDGDRYRYYCDTCWTFSPLKRTLEEARRVAMRKYSKPLTLEELFKIKNKREDHVWPYNTPPYLWLEKKETNDIWDCWACWRDVHDAITHGLHGCYPEDYGKTWRCWKTKPTDEERMNAPWERHQC